MPNEEITRKTEEGENEQKSYGEKERKVTDEEAPTKNKRRWKNRKQEEG